jgi:hypothetical protein
MHSAECDKPALTRLLWLHKVGEEPGHPDHNIGYDADVIDICPSCNGATLEALRHDCFDFEAVYDQYEWYEFEPADGERLRAVAARCEQPLNPFCNCAAHKSLRQSASALPRSSWDAIFEAAQHRHLVTVNDGAKPKLTLVRTGVELPKASEKPKGPDTEAVGFIFLAWPALLGIMLYGWFRLVHIPWFLDALVVLLAIPFTFVVAGVLLAAAKVTFSRKRRSTD